MISSSVTNKMPSLGWLICISLSLLICLHHVQRIDANVIGSSPSGRRLEIRPSNSVLVFEENPSSSKVIICKALGDQPGLFSQLRWSGPNDRDNFEQLKQRHKIKERNPNSLELEFINPTKDDSGNYTCHGNFQSSDPFEATIAVKVYSPIKLENCNERQFVVMNETNQRISCRVTGDSLQLAIYKDGALIKATDSRYKWSVTDDSLDILGPATPMDAGTYTIEVTTDINGDRRSQHINVEVHSRPQFVQKTLSPTAIAEYTGVEGQQAELKCEVTGVPKPLVNWLDPRMRNLTQVGGYFVNPTEGTLLISRVNRVDDNGNFTCIARNHVDEIKRAVSMSVLVKPQITKFENKTVDEGSEAILECRATGYPRPKFSIRKQGLNQLPYKLGDGYFVEDSNDEEGGGAEIYVYRLKIRADKTNHGLHYCNASNLAGPGPESQNQLFVRYKPDLSGTPKVQYVRLGANITILCHVQAYPVPSIEFYNDRGQQIINVPTNIQTTNNLQTHIVTIQPTISILSDNFERYKCLARNDMGSTEQYITLRTVTAPGLVNAVHRESTPTTVKFLFVVSNDGGDRIRVFKYKLSGRPLNQFDPIRQYPLVHLNESYIDAVPGSDEYTIRNLLPYYTYQLTIWAVNGVREGDKTELNFETKPATAPEPPIIIKPSVRSPAQTGFTSDYKDGYVLKWSPPDLDNGDPITSYIIKIQEVNPDQPDVPLNDGEKRLIGQSFERPLHARIEPLETNRYYRIQLQAENSKGASYPSSIIVYTSSDRPMMPDQEPQALIWLTEPSTPVLVGLLILAIISLIIIDLIFCYCFQIGVSHFLRGCCCPAKANSVISDTTYT